MRYFEQLQMTGEAKERPAIFLGKGTELNDIVIMRAQMNIPQNGFAGSAAQVLAPTRFCYIFSFNPGNTPATLFREEAKILASPFQKGKLGILNFDCRRSSRIADKIERLYFVVPFLPFLPFGDGTGTRRKAQFYGLDELPEFNVNDPVVTALAVCLIPSLEDPLNANPLFVDHLIMALMHHVMDCYGVPRSKPEEKRPWLSPRQEKMARDFIAENLDRTLSVGELADRCGLSRSHFSRAFKQVTGMPPQYFQTHMRIEKAKALLLNKQYAICEIADMCGFSDQSHFCRRFRLLVGVTPGDWRVMHGIVRCEGTAGSGR